MATTKRGRDHNRKAAGPAGSPAPDSKVEGTFQESPRIYFEKVAGKEYRLEEVKLDVDKDVALWDLNPRLLATGESTSGDDTEIAAKLRRIGGYDSLKNSIEQNGQMTPVFVWKTGSMKRYVVIEGNTRVTALRELKAKHKGTPEEQDYAHVIAKRLPPEFTKEDIVLLLVGIHVRGSGVRDWDRYVQAKTVFEAVESIGGQKPVTTLTKLASHMGKSVSWVSRLLGAYKFAKGYVDHLDTKDAQAEGVRYFSILEEISKSASFGPKVRDFDNPTYDELRSDVFQMVHRGVFTEYRDARYMKEFYEDTEKWALLKTFEAGIAKKLAAEINAGTSNLGTRIGNLPDAIKKTLVAKPDALSQEHLEHLQESVETLASYLTNSDSFRFQLNAFKKSLSKVSMADLEQVTAGEIDDLVARLQRIRVMTNQQTLPALSA